MIDYEITQSLYEYDKKIDYVLFSNRKVAIWHKGIMSTERAREIMKIVVKIYYRRNMQMSEFHYSSYKRIAWYYFGTINADLKPDMEIAFIKSVH